MATGAQSNTSATSLLREWLRDRIALATEVRVSELAEEAVQFLADDQDRLNLFVTEQVYHMASEITRAVLLETRKVRKFYEAAAQSEAERAERLTRWFARMEHQPLRGTYARLGSMTRHDLLAAAEEREQRAMGELITARWYRMLAAGLRSDDETVRERYTAEEVQVVYDTATGHVVANLDALIAGADEALRNILNTDDSSTAGDETA